MSEEKPLPPMHSRVRNAIVAGSRIISAAARGNKLGASTEVQASRLAVCLACEEYRKSDETCAECGCPVKNKIALSTESCPLGKWHAVNRVPSDKEDILDGEGILEYEAELRDILEVTSPMVTMFNEYRQSLETGNCNRCIKKRYKKIIEKTISSEILKMNKIQKQKLRDLFTDYKYIKAPSVTNIDDLIGEKQ